MSISNEIIRLQNAKSALATSIGNKGVTVPASTKLDGYPALVDQIQTGGGGGTADDGVWHRPSNWPDYTKIPMSSIGTSEVYLTYDCRYAKAGMEPKAVSFKCTASGGYDVERGYIGNNGFVSVDSEHLASNGVFFEYLPTDEGDFVVYKVSSENNITNFNINSYSNYIGNKTLDNYKQPVLEMYGKLEYTTNAPFSNFYMVSFAVVLKSVTSFLNAFQDCINLENVDTTGWNTGSATTMQSMFSRCYTLKYIDVSKFDTGKVTTLLYMFIDCRSLTHIDVSGWNVEKVVNTQQTFRDLRMLNHEIDLSKWDMSSNTNSNGMFASSYLVPKIHMPASLTTLPYAAFGEMYFCKAFIFDSVTPPTCGVNMFNNLNSSAKIYVPDESVNAYKTATNWSNWASYIYPLSDYTE